MLDFPLENLVFVCLFCFFIFRVWGHMLPKPLGAFSPLGRPNPPLGYPNLHNFMFLGTKLGPRYGTRISGPILVPDCGPKFGPYFWGPNVGTKFG